VSPAATISSAACPLCHGTSATHETQWKTYELLRCPGCDLVFVGERNIPQELYDQAYEPGSVYHRWYHGEAARVGARAYHVAWAWRKFFGLTETGARGKLLDIGCATGVFMTAARDRGWTIEGVEVQAEAAEVAREVTKVAVHTGTLEHAKYPNASFDAVTSWEVLEHVPDPVSFAREIWRVLKPGGVWALSTPNWRSPWERATKDYWRRPPFHLTYWSRDPLRRMLRELGAGEIIIGEKPLAWDEEVGKKKWAYLPVAVFRSVVLGQRANRLFGFARKPV